MLGSDLYITLPIPTSISYTLSELEEKVKHAKTISLEEEDLIWQSGVMDISTPKGLQNAAFYTACGEVFFACASGQEYRALKLTQLQHDNGKYVYRHENVSKNRAEIYRSFKQLHVSRCA